MTPIKLHMDVCAITAPIASIVIASIYHDVYCDVTFQMPSIAGLFAHAYALKMMTTYVRT